MALERARCDECRTLERVARQVGGVWRCRKCGAEFDGGEGEPRSAVRVRPRVSRPPPEGTPTERIVRSFVRDVLAYSAAVARVERAAKGAVSSAGHVFDTLRSGVTGTGNTGTHGVGRAPAPEYDAPGADPEAAERMRRLSGESLRVAEAVAGDGQGDQIAPVTIGARTVECTLAQRVALRCAPARDRERWGAKILSGDSSPALAAAEDLGLKLLDRAAVAWWTAF